jgi:hypothetical protein
LRHTLEFLSCLESGFASGTINYDQRARDKSIEASSINALALIVRIRSFVSDNAYNKPLTLIASYGRDSTEACAITTNYSRELAYNIEHAVHHMAIMKIALREIAPYLKLADDFGVAVSTIRHKAIPIQIMPGNPDKQNGS